MAPKRIQRSLVNNSGVLATLIIHKEAITPVEANNYPQCSCTGVCVGRTVVLRRIAMRSFCLTISAQV
jgi:hypothetical protein